MKLDLSYYEQGRPMKKNGLFACCITWASPLAATICHQYGFVPGVDPLKEGHTEG